MFDLPPMWFEFGSLTTHTGHYNDKDEVLLISELRVPLFSYSYGTVFGNSVAQIRSFNKESLVIMMETLWLIFGRCGG